MANRLIFLDTNILIAASKQQFNPIILSQQYDRVLVSFVAEVEALGYQFPNPLEEIRMLNLLAGLERVPFGEAEAYYAIRYRKARKIKFPDAAILATARAAGADLLTENLADFRGLDAQVRVLGLADL